MRTCRLVTWGYHRPESENLTSTTWLMWSYSTFTASPDHCTWWARLSLKPDGVRWSNQIEVRGKLLTKYSQSTLNYPQVFPSYRPTTPKLHPEVAVGKVQEIWDWPIPTMVTQLHAFLGLSGYYRCFIKGFVHIVVPLTQLLCKDGFQWTSHAQDAFDT